MNTKMQSLGYGYASSNGRQASCRNVQLLQPTTMMMECCCCC
ncbi:hypothetical protein [Niabella aurantiaca]|nr:hypothetical protein [Niabella aurantiaca]